MTSGPAKGPTNGSDEVEAIRAAAIAKAASKPLAAMKGTAPSPLLLPPGAGHACRFPHLEHFAARAMFKEPTPEQVKKREQPDAVAYEVILGLRMGIATGRALTLTIPKGVHGRELAQLLADTAASITAWADECEAAGTDPRLAAEAPAAPKGDAALPDARGHAYDAGCGCGACAADRAERDAGGPDRAS